VLFLDPEKLLVVLVLALVVLGPDKLPKFASQAGSYWGEFRRWRVRLEQEARNVFPDLPDVSEIAQVTRSPMSYLNRLADRQDAIPVEASPEIAELPFEVAAPEVRTFDSADLN